MDRRGQVGRRALLVGTGALSGGLALGLVGRGLGWWSGTTLLGGDPSSAVRRVARRSAALMVAVYDRALAQPELAVPANRARLETFAGHHREQLAALDGGPKDVEEAPLPGTSADGLYLPALGPLPNSADLVPAYFATAEQEQADLLGTAVRIVPDGQLARLLALIVASNTAHIVGWTNG